MLYNESWDKSNSNPVSDVLRKGADLIEKHGHAKFTRRDKNGSMCFLGALDVAQGRNEQNWKFERDTELTRRAAVALSQVVDMSVLFADKEPDKRYVTAEWNNLPERTAQEVIDAMRLAADVYARTHAKELA
jgi:hypothetical protein